MVCGNKFEIFQSMKDEPVKTCPKCGGKVKRLIGSGAGPIFKGTGFYQTDYKN
ncbi:MAG: FmdB family zinc ribbon protein, partial [Ignavibacteria bacterium]